jgi:sugar phosphate isomerase/epimerase
MAIVLGSAAAPRWWDLDLAQLDAYLARLRSWGATSAELVLHHGPADEQTARVHIVQTDWSEVIRRFHAAGLICHVHAPLTPPFSLRRWHTERHDLQRLYLPILAAADQIAQHQGSTCVVVVHGANLPEAGEAANATVTIQFLDWAASHCERELPGVMLALELRRARAAAPMLDASRTGIVSLVERVASQKIGICWDLGHDWENRLTEQNWQPIPSPAFLSRVIHVHAHDAGPDGAVHYPLVTHRVPIDEHVAALRAYGFAGAITLEIRYRYAAALGDPLAMLQASYERMRQLLGD